MRFIIPNRVIVLILFSFSFGLWAQDHIQFKNYTIDDGLSQSTVSCMIQDRFGALWVGTQDGINRFNGKNFEIYSGDRGYEISNDFINCSYKDYKHNLWFGTNNGLVKHNPYSVKFSSYIIDSSFVIDIHSITEKSNGNLLIGTAQGEIYEFNVETEVFKLLNKSQFKSPIKDLKIINNSLLVVSETDGVLLTDFSFSQTEILKFEKNHTGLIINKLIEHPNYDYVITTNKGVYYYNETVNSFKILEGIFSPLKGQDIIDVLFLSDKKIIVATENKGLIQIALEADGKLNIIEYSADIFQKGALISNKLKGLYKDNKGIIWISSERGISSFNPQFIGFKGVGISGNPNNGLPTDNVWGFDESADERFLYIAGGHGVSAYDRIKHKFYHYYKNSENSDDATVLCIKHISNQKLLIGSFDGLYELIIDENLKNYTYRKIENKLESTELNRSFDFVYFILPFTKENTFLLGTRGGMAIFDYSKKSFEYLMNNPSNPNSIGNGACRFGFEDDGKYYVAPSSGGLYLIKETENGYETTMNHEFSSLNHHARVYFTSVGKENDENYWFGTVGEGIYHFNKKTQQVQNYDKKDGLANNVIYGVSNLKENSNYIWISTNKGVSAFNTKTKTFFNFSDKDGLMSNEMNLGASFVSKAGEIYFGGIQGFNYFNPKDAFDIHRDIFVYFLGLEVDNEPIFPEENGILSISIAFTKKIVLPYNKKSFKLRFFADDLSNPEQIEYKYILQGKDVVEEELGSLNELRFTNLKPGYYELSVYAKMVNGDWNKHPAKLIIELEKPFWQTWWFYVISGIILVFSYIIWSRKRINESRRRQVRLEMRIAERTRELRKKNEQIQQQKNQLEKQTIELEKEKEKSERILNNVLPKETSKQLKKDGRAAAREFKKVSILFTDFVGFSKISETMSAQDLVAILDKHFSEFDEIIERNNLEKIKTIGDAYMAAGGVPIRNKTNPIHTVLAAIQIREYMRVHKHEMVMKDEPYWELRIGINTGSVSAGVIGTKRYAYDIWGSAVNRAQRMEELCKPGEIAITKATYNYVEPYFEFEEVGKVLAKGGIKITMYYVKRIKPELSINGLGVEPNEAFHKLVDLHHYSKINYIKAERFIMKKLEEELDSKLHYHSFQHSIDVTRQVERIAIGEGITDEDLFLLKSAASYHDAGFIEQYEKNEHIGARMAGEILPEFGYTDEQIERIKELIYVTEVPHKPKNLLEQIICDADLDYLGRDDFFEISDKLRRELREHGKINSDRLWDEMQVKFFEKHNYFTRTAIETRLEKKKEHLEVIKKRLAKNNYID